jgi:hypothetical protein
MKKIVFILMVLFATVCAQASAQVKEGVTLSGQPTGQPPFPVLSYKELPNPKAADPNQWKAAKTLLIGWGSTDIRYPKEAPSVAVSKSVELVAWKGERVAAQLVVSSKSPLRHLNYQVGEPINGNQKIGRNNLFSGFVRYVMTDELNKDRQGGCGARPNAAAFDSSLVADPIDHLSAEIEMKVNSTQGIWIRVWVPRDIKAGVYSTNVTVRDSSRVLAVLPLRVRVLPRTLPAPSDWTFHLDLWQNPYAVARYYGVKLWSKEHFDCIKPLIQLYHDAGGKVITTSIIHKPWNGQTYDYYNSMITWIKKMDGSWTYDYSVFDRWVEFMMSMGINKEINCYTMIPWKLSFQYFDQATNTMEVVVAHPGDEEYEALWLPFLRDFASHLKAKGWFSITCISMDERPMDVMQKVIRIIHKADKDFKISLAGALHSELSDDLYDYCVALRMKYTDEQIQRRKAHSQITSFYTSCEEPRPNFFTFSSPAEAEWMGWYAAKAGLDGYLRWSLFHWVKEPLLDSRFYTWAAGDTYMLYPGARTSIRFERLVSGIQSYEKVRILREELVKNHRSASLKKIDNVLRQFDEMNLYKQPAYSVVKAANKVINGL